MVQHLTPHPAADRDTPATLVIEQDRPIVGLSTWLVDAQMTAAQQGREWALLTSTGTRITFPLQTLFSDGLGHWAVRCADGIGFYDGLTGQALGWSGTSFFAHPDTPPPPMAPEHATSAGTVLVDAELTHPATHDLELGGLVDDVHAAWGREPAGWGVAEPVAQPWTRRELTTFVRKRAPQPTTLTTVGGPPSTPAIGLHTTRRVTTGVTERLRLAIGTTDGPDGADRAALDMLAQRCTQRGVRSMTVAWQAGRSDATRAPEPLPRPTPLGLLIPASGLAQEEQYVRQAPASSVELLGSGKHRSAWCRFDPTVDSTDALAAVVTHLTRHA